jgi:Sulphur transport
VDIARRPVDPWRRWFLGGTVIGAAVVSLLAGYTQRGLSYGALGEYLSLPALAITLFGGIVFGAGWAITGACPGTAATTIGGGSLMDIVLAADMVAGIALRDWTAAREAARANTPATAPDVVMT